MTENNTTMDNGASTMNEARRKVAELTIESVELSERETMLRARADETRAKMSDECAELRRVFNDARAKLDEAEKPFHNLVRRLDGDLRDNSQKKAKNWKALVEAKARLSYLEMTAGTRGIETVDDIKNVLVSLGSTRIGETWHSKISDKIRVLDNDVRIFSLTHGFSSQYDTYIATKGKDIVGVQHTKRSLHRGDDSDYRAYIGGLDSAHSWAWKQRCASNDGSREYNDQMSERYGIEQPMNFYYRNAGFSYKEWVAVLKVTTDFVALNLTSDHVKSMLVEWVGG